MVLWIVLNLCPSHAANGETSPTCKLDDQFQDEQAEYALK